MKKILFLCTGNICRSSTAEAIARKIANDKNLSDKLHFDSAGTTNYHAGENSDSRAIKVALQNGVDLSDIISRQIKNNDFINFDHILCMDNSHLQKAKEICDPKYHHKIELFMQFASRKSWVYEVYDPYYSSDKSFEEVFELIYNACNQMITRLMEGL